MKRGKGATHHFFLLCVFALIPCALFGQSPTEEELERWFETDEPLQPYRKRGGSEELEFIAPDTTQRIPFSQTRLSLSSQGIETGWVAIVQCHEGLDAVPDTEVVYSFRQMRGLRVTEVRDIGRARIEGQSVQLKDVGKGARLCVELEARLFAQQSDGRYLLRYGPFQRRFLDSYFPLHIAIEMHYPAAGLTLEEIAPTPAEGYILKKGEGYLALEAWFRGKLTIELRFRPAGWQGPLSSL